MSQTELTMLCMLQIPDHVLGIDYDTHPDECANNHVDQLDGVSRLSFVYTASHHLLWCLVWCMRLLSHGQALIGLHCDGIGNIATQCAYTQETSEYA